MLLGKFDLLLKMTSGWWGNLLNMWGLVDLMLVQILSASWWRYELMGVRLVIWWRIWEDSASDLLYPVTNLVAAF